MRNANCHRSFSHWERNLRVVTHVDDFLASREMRNLAWFKGELARLKVDIAGWEPGYRREIWLLGRTIRTTQYGVELDGADKHVKKFEE